MYKKNKYNGKKYKKKKVYSKIKDPYVVSNRLSKKKEITGIEIFMELFKLNDAVWLLFFKDILKGQQSTPVPDLNRLENIIYITPDESIQKQIYSELMDIKEYNPLKDKIPVEKLSPHIQNYIKKKQIEIGKQCFMIKKQTFYIKNNILKIPIKCGLSFNDSFQKIHFKNGYGVIFYIRETGISIQSNFSLYQNGAKYKVTLESFHKTLINAFPTAELKDKGHVFVPLKITGKINEDIKEIIDILQYNISVK